MRKTVILLDLGGEEVSRDVTDYMGEYEYKNKVLSRIHNTEGSCVRNGKGAFEYEYTLKDHLGNTRVTFSDENNDGTIDPNTEIRQINHFYCFGLNMEGNWNGQGGANKYQYNGKEWNDDFGLGWNDYGARFYDPAMARWLAVDPLAEKYLPYSPYVYAGNNPIKFIDPNGKEFVNPHTERRKEAEQQKKINSAKLEVAKMCMAKWDGVDTKKLSSNDKKAYKSDTKALSGAQKDYNTAKSNFDTESKFEKQVDLVIDKFRTVNPAMFNQWNNLKIGGKKWT